MPEKDDQMYVYQLFGVSTPRKIKANNVIRSKIGPVATIDEKKVLRAQRKIDNPDVDFKPYAMEYIVAIENICAELKTMDYGREAEYNRTTIPISQLKGQAAMFGNQLVSDVSAKILRFLEHYKRLDNDVIDIIDAYCRTIRASYDNYITDLDDTNGQRLVEELGSALKRYTAKFKKRTET